MFRSILVVALFVTQAHDAQAQLTAPAGKFPLSTLTSNSMVPVKDFTVILAFSETVQKSSNVVKVTVEDNAATTSSPDASKIEMACNSPTAKWFNKVVLVPITSSGGLKAGTTQKATIPSNCFKAYRSSSTTDVYMSADTTFSFKTEATDTCTSPGHAPVLTTGLTLGGSSIPYSPANGAWLSAPDSTKFELYFSESLLAGDGLVSITETTGSSSGTVVDSFAPSASATKIALDGDSIKGKLELKKGADWFKPGAKYAVSIANAAFTDKAGYALAAQFTSTDDYHVKVTTTLQSAKYPENGCCSNSLTTNYTINHKMILDFAHHVVPGTNALKLCSGWTPTSACSAGPTVATTKMMFLGKKVVLNPPFTASTSAVTYNVSIPDATFLYYSGMSADIDKKWTYTFSVDASTAVDTAPPELIAGFVDCDGSGDLVSSAFLEDSCSIAGSTFKEISSTLSADGNSVMLTAAQFKLYFKETVELKTGAKATLTADDGGAAVDVTTSGTPAGFAVGTTTQDCVVTVNPTLKTGKKYTLSIASGEITDVATLKNPYAGTSFTFYTSLTSGTTFPTGTNIPKETFIKVSFTDAPRLGPTPPTLAADAATPYLTINSEKIELTDTNAVKFQGNDIVVIPQTALAAGKTYTVTIPAHQLRYMTAGLSFSFTTRVEDVTKPRVMAYGPTATGIGKQTLDGTLGLPIPTTAYPKVPYVLFTESIAKGFTEKITIAESGGTPSTEYTISASDTTCTGGACLVIDTTYNSKVWLYPKGKTSVADQAVAWATAGRTYTVTLPDASFSDSITTGSNLNPLDKFSWTFDVSDDIASPTLSSIEAHATKTTGAALALAGGAISTQHSSMFLAFNENIVAGDSSMAIKHFDYSARAPAFLPPTAGTVKNDKYAAVALSFDQKVQAGSGSLELWKVAATDAKAGASVSVADAVFAGSKVLFTASVDLTNSNSYYIVSSAAGALKGAGGANMAAAINTKVTASASFVDVQSATTSRTVDVVYNSLSEYLCMPSNGKIPDATLYFNTRVTMASSATVSRSGGTCSLSQTGVSCDPDAATTHSTYCPTVIGLSANSAKTGIGIGAQTTSKKYKAVVYTSGKAGCTGTTFGISNAAFTTSAATAITTSAYSTTFSACTTNLDAFGSPLLRMYLASGTFGQKFSSGLPTIGKQFELLIPANAVKDTLGNLNAAVSTISWNHETSGPTLSSSASNPASGAIVDEYESVILAFNEVVQAGTGSFFLHDTSNTAEEAFAISVTSSATEPTAQFYGKYVTITPKTNCYDTRRRVGILNHTNATLQIPCGGVNETACPIPPTTTTTTTCGPYTSFGGQLPRNCSNVTRRLAEEEDSYDESWEGSEAAERRLQTTTCRTLGDLEAGKTYFVATTAPGVVKDVFGNELLAINTKTTWSVSVNPGSGGDTRAPKVVYATTPAAAYSSTWGVGPTLSGWVMFSEKVKAKSAGFSITLEDCGSDMQCGKGDDDIAVTIPSSALSYGDGTATDGTKEYGLLKYTKQVPTANSKFKLSIPASAVEDFSGGSSNNAGPSAAYTFYFPVGEVAFPVGTDIEGPTVAMVAPTVATRLAKTVDLVLHFNEDVQKGSGVVSFCTNSDASATVPCTTGVYENLEPALYDVENITGIDRRAVTMTLPNIKHGQTLYAMLPLGVIRDTSPSSNGVAAGMLTTTGGATYSFNVIDEDTVAPHLQMLSPPITTGSATTIKATDSIKLYFSEAVQVWRGLNISTMNGYDVTPSLTTTFASDQVHIGHTGGWGAGTTYRLVMGFDAFKDLAGNTISGTTTATPPALGLMDQQFTISGDNAAPTVSWTTTSPLTVTTAATSTVFELNFNEIVQKGTGKISIYSSGAAVAGSSTTILQDEFDVTSLPLVSSVGTGSIMMSSTTVQGSKAMEVGYAYRVIVPSSAYKDTVNYAFTTMSGTAHNNYKKVNENGDCQSPVFLTASMGETANTGSNAAFPASGGKIVMYFSENVQSASSGSVKLAASAGGSFCSGTGAGCANIGTACGTACGYTTTSASDVVLSTMTISGSKVSAAVPVTLQSGYGYKLSIDRRAFTDTAGNSLTTDLPGDATVGLVYTLKVASSTTSTDSTGPLHKTTSATPPALTSTFPATGSQMMPPSTAIVISFDETVQAGTGSVTFNADVMMSVSDCMFDSTFMRCKPPGDLASNTVNDIIFPQAAVMDVAMNTLRAATVGSTNSKLTFTTTDLDYSPPTLAAVGGVTYAAAGGAVAANSVDYAKPFDPANGATKVSKGTLISMTFSETVQSGAGNVLLNGATVSSTTYFSGSTVYMQKADLTQAATYAITMSGPGVFKDVDNQPVAQITSGWSFTVVPDDQVAPTMLQSLPKDDTSLADDAPSTMITLYFSEGVQAVTGGKVTVGSVAIPVDNTDLSKGSVTVVGGAVIIDPFDDVGYDKTVEVKIGASAFSDLFGDNSFAGTVSTPMKFRTPSLSFNAMKTNNVTIGFSQREGSILQPMTGYMMLYGGIESGEDGDKCTSDAWTSTTGATWVAVTLSAVNPGEQAYSKSTIDENGCVYIFGNSGPGCAGNTASAGFKTCGVNTTTGALEFTTFASPPPLMKGDGAWPSAVSGHGIAIVGGWKFVLVDSLGGNVWTMLDKEMTIAEQVATSVPFSKRKDPIMLTDSGNILYLLGGYDGDACSATDVYCSAVFTDVWHSADFGATWGCMTANYAATMTSTYTKGIGRYVGGLMTHDDTMFLIAGALANETASSSDLWTSAMTAADSRVPSDYTSSMVPENGATGVMTDATVTLYFDELISYKSGGLLAPRLETSTATLTIATSISRQVMTMSLTGTNKFTAGNQILVKIPADSLQDAAGNTLGADLSYAFTITTDATKPTFDSFTTTSNSSSGWDKRATSMTMLALTTSEPVYAVGGVVNVSSTVAGSATVQFDLMDSTTDVYNYVDGNGDSKGMIFFTMPVGANLTENTLYTISIPAGMVKDAAGNLNGKWDRFTFKTISGSTTYNDYASPFPSIPNIPTLGGNVNDTTKPAFVSMWPAVGAGDVLASPTQSGPNGTLADASVYLFFDEPVKFNATAPGLIQIVNNTNKVVGSINLTYEYVVSAAPIVGHVVEMNATKITIGQYLKKDQNFTISVPAGVIVDMRNNPISAFTKTFKTLSENADTVAPVAVRATPYDGQSVLSSSYSFGVWFSERVVPGAGSITIKTGSTTSVTMDITDSNVTIAGPKMTFSFYSGALSTAGAWKLVLPPGLLKDEAGNQYRGLNATGGAPSQDFTVVTKDTTKPTLSSQLPATEATATYVEEKTTALQLTFDEAVQAASTGAIVFTPKYTSPTLSVASSSSEVAIAGSLVVVSPVTDLMPGEVYSITIESGAFTDIQGNAYAGLTTGYTMSTKAMIAYTKASSGNFDADTASTNPNFYNGERYGAAVAVDASNNLYVIGGHNGTVSGTGTRLNDVWKLATMRDVNCAASIQPTHECTTDGEMPSTTNLVTQCDGVTGVYAGKSNFNRTIWKAPTAGGRACQMYTGTYATGMQASGKFASQLGQILQASYTQCPCPLCTAPPFNLSAEKPMFNAIPDYTFASDLPLMANTSTLNLTCQTGYEPDTTFVCGFDTLESGKFLEPYPECQLSPCRELPTLGTFMALDALECNSSMTRFAHLSSCNYICDAGYGAFKNGEATARLSASTDGKFTCNQGVWEIDSPGSCSIMSCDTGGTYGDFQCRTSETSAYGLLSGEPVFGTDCQVTCPIGGANIVEKCVQETPGAFPQMVSQSAVACPTTTTTTTTPTPKTTVAVNVTVTTAAPTEEVYITHSVSFSQDFPEGTTADSLLADTSFTNSVKTGLLDAVSAAIPDLAGQITEDNIVDLAFTLTAMGGGAAPAPAPAAPAAPAGNSTNSSRRLASRRLAVMKLTVDYSVRIPPTVTTSVEDLGKTLVSNKGAFESTMASSYAKAYEANTGAPPPGFTGVEASTEVGSKVVSLTTTPAPTPAPTSAPTPAPTPAAPAAAAAAAEEEDDGSAAIIGGVVGGIAGVAILGGVFYMYKKKQASE